MPEEIPIAPANTPTNFNPYLDGDFVFPLALNSMQNIETTLLMSSSRFTGLYGEDEEEEYPSDDDSSSSDDDDFELDSDFYGSDYFEEYILDDSDPEMRPASKTVIEGLEKVKINEELGKSVGFCSVCLEEMVVGTEARRLPCSHVYHGDCIVEWLNGSNMCPLCRYKMPVVDFDLNVTLPAEDGFDL
ncbi:Zinc finger, RING-type [Corchorus olitorius]|uniref:RING-type E3 ubiquitin transferase n=1 Tax=Corchorus olitorius TaxID=93759 RepID=A0A1R3GW36_9ROSI|nr:Zinc finger, RING-type [Corchorus olitorius]